MCPHRVLWWFAFLQRSLYTSNFCLVSGFGSCLFYGFASPSCWAVCFAVSSSSVYTGYIPVMLVNVSRSPEVTLDALQRSAFVSVSAMLNSLCFCSVRLIPSQCSFAFFAFPTGSLDACIPITYEKLGLALFVFIVACLLRYFQHLSTWGCQRITGHIQDTRATGLASHL